MSVLTSERTAGVRSPRLARRGANSEQTRMVKSSDRTNKDGLLYLWSSTSIRYTLLYLLWRQSPSFY